ncbi:hypothetical protein NDN08_004097 [Rhodosorus marinus]|uniref:Uncharacterized protein n=1 Tax=Rhodosorus marinus TaxID=101924 RepID=A0AAV8UKR0_9RHOD|nr:hypothetical protein NDN08_004097 [Rhodosorus marinus]
MEGLGGHAVPTRGQWSLLRKFERGSVRRKVKDLVGLGKLGLKGNGKSAGPPDQDFDLRSANPSTDDPGWYTNELPSEEMTYHVEFVTPEASASGQLPHVHSEMSEHRPCKPGERRESDYRGLGDEILVECSLSSVEQSNDVESSLSGKTRSSTDSMDESPKADSYTALDNHFKDYHGTDSEQQFDEVVDNFVRQVSSRIGLDDDSVSVHSETVVRVEEEVAEEAGLNDGNGLIRKHSNLVGLNRSISFDCCPELAHGHADEHEQSGEHQENSGSEMLIRESTLDSSIPPIEKVVGDKISRILQPQKWTERVFFVVGENYMELPLRYPTHAEMRQVRFAGALDSTDIGTFASPIMSPAIWKDSRSAQNPVRLEQVPKDTVKLLKLVGKWEAVAGQALVDSLDMKTFSKNPLNKKSRQKPGTAGAAKEVPPLHPYHAPLSSLKTWMPSVTSLNKSLALDKLFASTDEGALVFFSCKHFSRRRTITVLGRLLEARGCIVLVNDDLQHIKVEAVHAGERLRCAFRLEDDPAAEAIKVSFLIPRVERRSCRTNPTLAAAYTSFFSDISSDFETFVSLYSFSDPSEE